MFKDTNKLIAALQDIAARHDAQYAEDCTKALLGQGLITTDQYCEVMEVLYGTV